MNGLSSTCFLFPDVSDFDMIEAESPMILKIATLRECEEGNYLPVGKPIKVNRKLYYQQLIRYKPYSYEA
jgi:hypothetical protein|tara:strand:- start:1015 stop:1224 length:210 start_codon:yes stop_codon:yes gene_type:complete